MKTTILIIGAVLFSTGIFAQKMEISALDTLSAKYIQLLPIGTFANMGNKLNVSVDYGAKKVVALADQGKLVVFNSPAHMLNFWSEHGWELVEVYFISSGVKGVGQRFLLRKRSDIE